MRQKIRCIRCKAQNYIKKGFRKTENRGKIQKYKCLSCGKYFTNDDGFYRMRNSSEKITAAIDLYFSNLSSRKVRNHFKRHWERNASHITILDWCRRYVLKVQKYVDGLQPTLSGEYYADETEIDCEKRNDVFWACVDWDTRFIVGTHYSFHQSVEEATEFLTKLNNKQRPKYVQTDAGMFYPKAFKKTFAGWWRKDGVEHRVINFNKTKKYNVRIETVFSKIKDRVDDFRGLKALWSAPILLNGIILQHNFIEAHTTTGKIPSELAGLKVETGQNRWLDLIKLSALR